MWGGDICRDSQGSTKDLEWTLKGLTGLAFFIPHPLPCPLFLTTSSLEPSHISVCERPVPLGISSFLVSGSWFPGVGAVWMYVHQAWVSPKVCQSQGRNSFESHLLENPNLTQQWGLYSITTNEQGRRKDSLVAACQNTWVRAPSPYSPVIQVIHLIS